MSCVAGPATFINGARSKVTTVTPAVPGEYRFRLIVRDGQDDSEPAEVSFTVKQKAASGGGGGGSLHPLTLLALWAGLAIAGMRRRYLAAGTGGFF